MPKLSAGLLVFRQTAGHVEVLLVHPGGPFWAQRDEGAWSVPKGEYDAADDPLTAAFREFREEIGLEPPDDVVPIALGEVRQSGGKRVTAWAVCGDLEVASIHSNTFVMEWPPRSGTTLEFPEVDRAGWFDLGTARWKLVAGQVELLDRLAAALDEPAVAPDEPRRLDG
jgi:predicted NUDIX family NTP pyrophosphohydrolase